MKRPLVFRWFFDARTVKPARLNNGVDAGTMPERNAQPVKRHAVEHALVPDETRPAREPDETELPLRIGHGSAVENAPTPNETRPARTPDESEPTQTLGHEREGRTHKRKEKNTTGLKPAWNGDLQPQDMANQ